MLFVKLGQDLINLGAVTRIMMVRPDADDLVVHFAGCTTLELTGGAGTALLEELVNFHDAKLLVLRNRPAADGGNGDGTVPQRQGVRPAAHDDGGRAGAARHVDPRRGREPGPGEGVRGDEPAAGEEPLFAPQRRADQPAPQRRRRSRSGGAAA